MTDAQPTARQEIAACWAEIHRLRTELATAHEIVGQCVSAMQAVLTLVNGERELPDALDAARVWLRRKDKTMISPFIPPDIPDEGPNPTPGGPEPEER